MAYPLNIINKLLADVGLEFFCQFIDRAGKHKVLPYHQSQLITEIKEPVVRIESSAPHPDGVKICLAAVFQKFSGPFFAPAAEQVVFRYIICSHGKKADPVYFMGKAFSPLVFFPSYSHCPQTDLLFPDIADLSP